jgi:hypothetical protein
MTIAEQIREAALSSSNSGMRLRDGAGWLALSYLSAGECAEDYDETTQRTFLLFVACALEG